VATKPLDPADIRILNLLQQDASLELSALSARVFKSPSSVHERIRKLKERGIIKGYVAVLDPRQLGRPFLAVTQVCLNAHTKPVFDEFHTRMGELPEVLQCLQLSGAYDFLLQVAVKDAQAYQEFLMNTICALENVARVQSSVVLKECKSREPFLL
jgi:Lrp/AsnC family leucine-responsive transcriptional regulator